MAQVIIENWIAKRTKDYPEHSLRKEFYEQLYKWNGGKDISTTYGSDVLEWCLQYAEEATGETRKAY